MVRFGKMSGDCNLAFVAYGLVLIKNVVVVFQHCCFGWRWSLNCECLYLTLTKWTIYFKMNISFNWAAAGPTRTRGRESHWDFFDIIENIYYKAVHGKTVMTFI